MFATATAPLGRRAAVLLRAHDRPLAQWLTWLAAVPRRSLRIGVSAPLVHGIREVQAAVADLAAAGVDFVHLAEALATEDWARARLSSDLAFSRACHDRVPGAAFHEGLRSFDWLVVSPVFATPSKPGAPALGLDALAGLARAGPGRVLALGGIDAGNALQTLASGAAGIACLRAAWHDAEALTRAGTDHLRMPQES